MRLLPFEGLSIDSPLDSAAVLATIREATGERRSWTDSVMRPMPSWAFEGTVYKDGFYIQPAISYRNRFLPQIRGKVTDHLEGGSTVSLRLLPDPFALMFLILWFVVVGAVMLWSAFELATGESDGAIGVLVGLGMLGIVWGTANVKFKAESGKARAALTELLQPRP